MAVRSGGDDKPKTYEKNENIFLVDYVIYGPAMRRQTTKASVRQIKSRKRKKKEGTRDKVMENYS